MHASNAHLKGERNDIRSIEWGSGRGRGDGWSRRGCHGVSPDGALRGSQPRHRSRSRAAAPAAGSGDRDVARGGRPRRGRMTPPSGRSRDTRQRLLEVAGEVFAERGFRDATIQEICRRADANIAAVHYHFGDKEELYRTVIQYAEERAAESADVAPDAPAEKRLRAHIESFLVRLFD